MREVYLELKEYVKFPNRKIVYIKDIAKVYASERIQQEVLNIPVDGGDKKQVSMSSLDIIKAIKTEVPLIEVRNIGAQDVVVYFEDFLEKDKLKNKIIKILEIIFGSLVVLCGSFVAIMTFQTDVSLSFTLSKIYSFFTGIEDVKPLLIQIPYSIGILIGATTFFSKFKKTKVSPIEIEIDKYEKDVVASESKKLEKEQGL